MTYGFFCRAIRGIFALALFVNVAVAQAPRGRHPNVLLITIDTLRADHVGCYGDASASTPVLDGIARDGVRFDRALSQVPLTWPSHASILTGTYPFSNGVQDFTGQPLSPKFRNVAEAFRANGYATAAVVSSFVLDRSWGLSRGFDRYFDSFQGSSYFENNLALVQRPAGPSVSLALGWLRNQHGRPFFLWLHLYDPHSPYNPPEPFHSRFRDRLYDGEIAYADHEIARLVSWLKQTGAYAQTVIVVASDHGESLGDHGEREHGFFLYNSTLRVPLIVKPAAVAKAGGRHVADPVGLISIAPTLLELAGITDPIQKQFQAPGLAAAIEGRAPTADTPVYSETFYPFSSFGWSPLRSLETRDHHYIQAPQRELYEDLADPAEQSNVVKDHTAVADVLHQDLEALAKRYAAEAPPQGPALDPDVQAKLRALGYMPYRSPVPAAKLNAALPDPKDKLSIFNSILSATDALDMGDFARGESLLRDAERQEPELYVIPFLLGEGELRQLHWPEAARELKRALDLNPSFDQALLAYARALNATGDAAGAKERLQAALRANPQDYRAWYELGWIQLQSAPDAAADALQHALTIQPAFAPALRDLGILESNRREYAAATLHLSRAAELGIEDAPLFNLLGIAYSQTQKLEKAVESYRRAIKSDPKFAEAHLNLGFAYQKLKRGEEARAEYETACRLQQNLCRLAGIEPR